ncbi:MAG: hypothetical protein IKF91_06035 [Bacilli bacterium]|nr:hypothetical protein [Bacilli bacterium]
MSFEEVDKIRIEYEKKYNNLENKLKNKELSSSKFDDLEEQEIKIDETLDIIDDLLDAYMDKDEEDIKILEKQLKGRLVK